MQRLEVNSADRPSAGIEIDYVIGEVMRFQLQRSQ